MDECARGRSHPIQKRENGADRTNEVHALLNLANLHRDLNDNTQAVQFCQQSLAIASDLGIPLKDDCETLLRELAGDA